MLQQPQHGASPARLALRWGGRRRGEAVGIQAGTHLGQVRGPRELGRPADPAGDAAAGARMMLGGRPAAGPADADLGHGRRHDVELIAAVGVRARGVERPAARRAASIRAAGARAQHIDHVPHALPQLMDDFRDEPPAVPPRRRAADATGIRTEGLLAPRRGR